MACTALGLGGASCGSANETRHHPAQAPHDGHTRIVSVPWTLVSGEGQPVTLSWVGGGCLTPDRTQTVSTASVEIVVLARQYEPGPGEACPAFARMYVVRVRLRKALTHTKLLHAPVTPGPPPSPKADSERPRRTRPKPHQRPDRAALRVAATASMSARSLSAWPMCPLTQCQRTSSWSDAAASS